MLENGKTGLPGRRTDSQSWCTAFEELIQILDKSEVFAVRGQSPMSCGDALLFSWLRRRRVTRQQVGKRRVCPGAVLFV